MKNSAQNLQVMRAEFSIFLVLNSDERTYKAKKDRTSKL